MSRSNPSHGAAGDRVDEFVELFAATQQRLYVYIVSLVFDPTDAYDVLQDTNLALWQRFDDYQSGTNFFAWAAEVARYRVLRYRQHQGARLPVGADHLFENLATRVTDRSDVAYAEQLAALRDCLGKLTDQDRQIVNGRYQPEGSLRALAAQVGRSENALSQALRRIRRTLGDCVQRQLHQPGEA